jgi:hypothetical protein
MKWVLLPLLWLVAVLLAAVVLWRLWRGQNVVLRGHWGPRVIRIVAVVLVVLGIGAEKGQAVPAKITGSTDKQRDQVDAPLPQTVTTHVIGQWLTLQQPGSPWARFKRRYVALRQASAKPDAQVIQALRAQTVTVPEKLRLLLQADLDALASGKAAPHTPPAELLRALDELERLGYYDHWLGAYLWRKTADGIEPGERRGLIELCARLAQHARLTNTLIRAQARVKPILLAPRAWMSKGGHVREIGGGILSDQSQAEMLGAAKVLYAGSDIGTWKRDGVAIFTVTRRSAPATLVRAGRCHVLEAEETIRFQRLDLIETAPGDKPVVLEHAWLGQIELPAGRVVSVWDLAPSLADEAKSKLQKEVAAALGGSEEAAARLERTLPLAHRAIREGVAKTPTAQGAPRLRLLLTLFDDALLPASPTTEADPRSVPK